MFLNGKLT